MSLFPPQIIFSLTHSFLSLSLSLSLLFPIIKPVPPLSTLRSKIHTHIHHSLLPHSFLSHVPIRNKKQNLSFFTISNDHYQMPSSDSGENRRATKPQTPTAAPPPTEQEQLPCPRCDSTNTKFCYYNNYNYSQPRHFCKSCRRYWTHGGTLRDIPIGGGSRKNAKRSRINHHHHSSAATSLSSSSTVTSAPIQDHHPALSAAMVPVAAGFGIAGSGLNHDDMKQNVNLCGSFTSLLSNNTNTNGQGSRFLALGGFGLGLEDMGFGLGRAGWAFPGMVDGANVGGGGVAASGSWQLESGEGGFVSGDCFSWPGLAISTPGNGLN